MTHRILMSMSIGIANLLVGCATVKIDNPGNGATGVKMPQDVRITTQGPVTLSGVFLDNENISQFNNSNWQFTPRFWLTYVPIGSHTLFFPAENSKTHQNIGESSSFVVSACPLCYTCPTGKVHPITGQCCDNNICDTWAAGNSGVTRFNSPKCQEALFPGASEYYYERGCISSQTETIHGAAGGPPEVAAVRFVANQTGGLTHIRVPIGVTSGQGNVRVWLTADAGGSPGAPIETIMVQNIRSQTLPITSPMSVFSTAHPVLTAGTVYWLVIGPSSSTTSVDWNVSLDDFSIPNTPTFLVNRSTSDLTGPWVKKSTLAEPVPAYEIAVRQ